MNQLPQDPEQQSTLEYLKKLDARLTRIESYLRLSPLEKPTAASSALAEKSVDAEAEEDYELEVGEHWLTRGAILVLAIGCVFLLTFPYEGLPPMLPSLVGFGLVGAIFGLAYYWRESYDYLSRFLVGGGMLLLYFAALRLYFFSPERAVEEKSVVLILLVLIFLINLAISVKRESVYLTAISLAVGYATAVIGGDPIFVFTMITVLSLTVVALRLRYAWANLMLLGILLSFFTHLIWFLNNPILGNKIALVSSPDINIYFVLLYCVIFSLGNHFRDRNKIEESKIVISVFLNGILFYGLFLVLTVTRFSAEFSLAQGIAFSTFLLLSIIFWIREQSKYSTFIFAMLAYGALSAAITKHYPAPDYFLWLSWQSVLVIATAVWFRSKIIISANFVIFVGTVLIYFVTQQEIGFLSLQFGIVSLVSARILNATRDKLELPTDKMRMSYLLIAFVVLPYSLYHLLPGTMVSFAWLGLALFYYVMSLVLQNDKYRWMALFTLALTVVYVLIISITKLEPMLRIVSFFALGIVMLFLSVIYARTRSRKKLKNGAEQNQVV